VAEQLRQRAQGRTLAAWERLGSPIVRSFEPGEDWRWCYLDETLV
jgi:hypothetical protein